MHERNQLDTLPKTIAVVSNFGFFIRRQEQHKHWREGEVNSRLL